MHGSSIADGKNGLIKGAIDFTAGSLGGVALVYVSQPLDTVKVKMQTFPHLYNNMVTCTLQTFRKDGVIRGLYAGTLPAIVANVAENSVLFAAYGGCQSLVAKVQGIDNLQNLTPLSNASAGFLAAFFSSFTLCPTELIKCKLQALREVQPTLKDGEKFQRITPFQLTRQIFQQQGIAGFYRGLTSTFAREMPGYFFFFGGYEATRGFLAKPGQSKDDIGALRTMLAGSVGGLALWIAIFPADVIKSRIQVESSTLSMTEVGRSIIQKEGFAALYNGLKPTIFRTIPATAVLFVVYEYTKKLLSQICNV